jgi:hypothetical protein
MSIPRDPLSQQTLRELSCETPETETNAQIHQALLNTLEPDEELTVSTF